MSVITRVAKENWKNIMLTIADKYLVELEMKGLGERLELLKERLGSKIDSKLIAKLVRGDREAH